MFSENESGTVTKIESHPEPASKENTHQRNIRTNRQDKAMNDVLTRFTSCGRCSLFFAAYRLGHDDDVLEAAIDGLDSGWLPLPWDQNVRELIIKCYGCRIDVEAYYFESCCPECHGQFTYSEADPDKPATILIKI